MVPDDQLGKSRHDVTSRTGNSALPAAPQRVPRDNGENPRGEKSKTTARQTDVPQARSTFSA
jgi:hypothetical protein